MASSEEAGGEEAQEEDEKRKEAKGKYSWRKCKERIASFFNAKRKEEEVGKKVTKSDRRPRARQILGKSGRWLFLLELVVQSRLCVNAAAEGLQERADTMERWQQQEVQVPESRWAEEVPPRWKQPKGEDRTEKKKKRVKAAEVHLAKWISVEFREEVHEKIGGQMRYLLWD